MKALAVDSLERLVPDALEPGDATGRETLELHLERYRFAARHLRPGRVLDLACGVGYGAALLAEHAGVRVVGVDLDEAAIAYARRRHPGTALEFRVADALRFDDAQGFDTIVSLETVEHVDAPGALIERLAGLLRPGGHLVCSVPTTPSVDLNPHHRHDFSERSFRRLVAARAPRLRELAALRQIQPVSPWRVLSRGERRMRDRREGLPAYYLAHPDALARRLAATLRFGFSNRYLTLVWRAPSDGSGT
ncbi:MAG: methyltransferase domain-containing protein [Deltaproteobacteria bacterium]|nr:methyltransferase domain-containing protein [Deltaproteobacteria bacterium]